MAEQLQHLIERIQKEAIDQSEQEATQRVAKAREKAASIVREAEVRAKAILVKAEQDSEVFVERGTRTLEQAARDLLITVGQGIENILEDIVAAAADKAMDPDLIKQMMLQIAQAYCAHDGSESRIEFLIAPKDQETILRYFSDLYKQKLVHSVTIHSDNGVLKGFQVKVVDQQARHDFTPKAIAEALSAFLRPHLAEIVHRAARDTTEEEGTAR